MNTATVSATTSGVAANDNRIDHALRRYATQATTALSVVVGVTGVMMFFHIAKSEVEGLHEWLGLGFTLAALLHALRHRKAIAAMMWQPRMRGILAAAAVASLAFLLAPAEKRPNPFRQASQVVMQAPLRDLAPVLGIPAEDLTARLRAGGVAAADTTKSIETIARDQGADPVALMAAALRK